MLEEMSQAKMDGDRDGMGLFSDDEDEGKQDAMELEEDGGAPSGGRRKVGAKGVSKKVGSKKKVIK